MAQPVDPIAPTRTWTVQVSTSGALVTGLDRRRCDHDERAGRLAALTLLVVLDAPDAVDDTVELVRQVAPATPINTIVVVPSSGGSDHRDSSATLSILALGSLGPVATCVEDIVLRIAGVLDPDDLDHSVVEWILDSFARPGLPIVTWMPGRAPGADDPAVAVADRIIVDSEVLRAAASPTDRDRILPALLALDRRRTVVDLAWVRLEPWRQLTAGRLLGDERMRAAMGSADARFTVDVESEPTTALLLAGWLADGLASVSNHTSATARSSDGGRTRVEVSAEQGGRRARLLLVEADGRSVGVSIVTEDRQAVAEPQALLRLDGTPPHVTLHRALNISSSDQSWARAVTSARRLTAP